MTEIDYGRLDALEAVLGGRAAIEAAYQAKTTLIGGGAAAVRKATFSFDHTLSGGVAHEIATMAPGELLFAAFLSNPVAWEGTSAPALFVGWEADSEIVAGIFEGIDLTSYVDAGASGQPTPPAWNGNQQILYPTDDAMPLLLWIGVGSPFPLELNDPGASSGSATITLLFATA